VCRSNIFISKIPSYAILVWSGLQYTTRVGSSESPTLEQSLDETDEDVYYWSSLQSYSSSLYEDLSEFEAEETIISLKSI